MILSKRGGFFYLDLLIVIHVNGKVISTADIGLQSNYKPNSIEEIENIIQLCDEINICQGLDLPNHYSNIKSKLRQFEESFGRLRHFKCTAILKNNER